MNPVLCLKSVAFAETIEQQDANRQTELLAANRIDRAFKNCWKAGRFHPAKPAFAGSVFP